MSPQGPTLLDLIEDWIVENRLPLATGRMFSALEPLGWSGRRDAEINTIDALYLNPPHGRTKMLGTIYEDHIDFGMMGRSRDVILAGDPEFFNKLKKRSYL